MKTFTKIVRLLLVVLAGFFTQTVVGQSVMDPADPIVTYNASAPPTQPAFGQIGKWVRTKRLNWNTDSYKAYVYKGAQFRLKFPKTYNPTAVDGKKYPVFVFFHGLGETGTIYDNEYSLYHGGDVFRDAVDNGKFEGYIFVMQSGGFWGGGQFDYIKEIIDYMIANNKVDPFKIIANGLSAGGAGTWDMTIAYPNYIAASLPMSESSTDYQTTAVVNSLKYTPMWLFQGGLDGAPDPYTSQQVRDHFINAGGNFTYTEYPDLGHGTWDRAWTEPNFWPFANNAYLSNPWVLGGRSAFCAGDAINVTIGLTPGFAAYQWRKNGVAMSNTGNTISVTDTGTFDARVMRGTTWSDWSRTPAHIFRKTATVPPTITVAGLMSKVIPALDTSTGVRLQVPAGYASYLWQKVGSTTTVGTAQTLYATTPGDYKIQVTEQFGCSTSFSTPFTVIPANGPNPPDAAINLIITSLSKTSLRLDWSNNTAPQFNETNFEVYQATTPGGPYTLIGIDNADVLTHTVTGLNSNTTYYYKVRAVDNTAAAAASNVANGTTGADTQAPTAPSGLVVTGSSRTSISLSWNASSDDVGVTKYDVYVNGQKSYTTPGTTSLTVYNLQFGLSYNFSVKARDFANNVSPASNQVTGEPLRSGLNYKYYTFTGNWPNLPDFTTLTPVSTGSMPTVSITAVPTQPDNFAFLWEGSITIPTTGTYFFRTNSDDGSRLWLGALNGASSPYSFAGTPKVNNDGQHGGQDVTSTGTVLQAGTYPIAAAFFEQGGGQQMTVSWRTPSSGTSYSQIPASAYADAPIVNGQAPAAPSNVVATSVSYKQINVSWTDNSNNENGFEVWRSTNATTGFTTIGTVGSNTTSFVDSVGLNPSTAYFYQIKAIGQYGESALVGNVNFTDANWKFNNNFNDSSGNGKTLSSTGSPTFDATTKMEGAQSLKLNGTSQSVTMPTSGSFLQTAYATKTIAFWMRSAANTGNRIIADIGGSDDGLALRLDANTLYAGVASNNVRATISTPYNYATTVWNHIALVYNGNSLQLYVNGVLAVSNNALSFTTLTTTTNGSRIGTVNGTNAFNTGTGFFSGWIDNFVIYSKALTVADITNLMANTPLVTSSATTQPLPPLPTAPTGLSATGISGSKIKVTWTDGTNEDRYELYRSSTTNSNYLLFATLPANTVSFTDSGLFANTTNFYKVRGVNVAGPSAYSNEASAVTGNNPPTLTAIPNQFMRFGTTLNVPVQATDSDPETLTISVTNLPSGFAAFTPTTNGAGVISFTNPSGTGIYNNILVTVNDQHGGTSSLSFNLTVNDNYVPVIAAVNNVTLSEKQTAQVNLSATDQNAGDVLTWTFTGLPAFATPTITGGNVQFSLAPGYADNGVYTVTAKVDDGNSGTATTSFTITVNDVNPNKKIYVNFSDGSNVNPAPWNSTNKHTPTQNDDFKNMKDDAGNTTSIGLLITSPWQNLGDATNNYGVVTGNNSGVYPDNVMQTCYFTAAGATQTIRIHGLNPSFKYNFTFFGSRSGVTDDRTGLYTIGSTTVSLNAASNSTNTVSINSVAPAVDSTVILTLNAGPASSYGYLNAMVINALYDDGSIAAKPRNLAGQYTNGKVALTWVDAAYNETAYEVYKATSITGPYTLLNPGGNNANLQAYNDSSVLGNTTYYYSVRALNAVGGTYSDTLTVVIPNAAPVITAIADVQMKTTQTLDVPVVATDNAGDVITLAVTGLPAFGTFTPTGNGTGTIHLAPGTTIGNFPGVTVTATDNQGAASSKQFAISVANKDLTNYLVNFNEIDPVGAPWNSFNAAPNAGTILSNLKDDGGNASGISVTLVTGWDGSNDVGATTGGNSGVYPDLVMQTEYFMSSTAAHHIQIKGLPTAGLKYNLTFFASRSGVNDNRNTVYSYAGQSVTLNAAGNTMNTVSILAVSPDANGTIDFTATMGTGAAYGYIGAMVITSLTDNGLPIAPSNLVASPKSKTTIQLSWKDNANNEDGYEVYKSTSLNGTYTLLTTTAANITTYTDGSLSPSTIYYYKVRGKKLPSSFTDYTNTASASTLAYSVFVNFNDVNPPGGFWNSTNNAPVEGDVYPNFIDSLLNPTGINMTVVGRNFSGVNPYGTVTGNNSGLYPDVVLAETWWLDVGGTASIKLDGLSQASAYNLVFFASRDGGGQFADRTTVYSVGSQSVSLNAINNINQTVTLPNVKADENGAIQIDIRAGGVSPYGYIGALVIQSFATDPAVGPGGGTTTTGGGGSQAGFLATTGTAFNDSARATATATNLATGRSGASIYPNPFVDDVALKLTLDQPVEKATVRVSDIAGRPVFVKELRSLPAGSSQYNLGLNGASMAPGVYFVQIMGPGLAIKTIKIVKTR
ncbi:MAG TPA: fibronectin type III domain-containing protein [Puia sp.]|nr:fibronectin type III domain-containing protein [Puia sp.]